MRLGAVHLDCTLFNRRRTSDQHGAYIFVLSLFFFFFSSRRRHTRCLSDWSSDVCSSDLMGLIMLILIGTVPTAYALNRAPAPSHVAEFTATSKGAAAVIAQKAAGYNEIGRASCREECRARWETKHKKEKR